MLPRPLHSLDLPLPEHQWAGVGAASVFSQEGGDAASRSRSRIRTSTSSTSSFAHPDGRGTAGWSPAFSRLLALVDLDILSASPRPAVAVVGLALFKLHAASRGHRLRLQAVTSVYNDRMKAVERLARGAARQEQLFLRGVDGGVTATGLYKAPGSFRSRG